MIFQYDHLIKLNDHLILNDFFLYIYCPKKLDLYHDYSHIVQKLYKVK